MIKAFAHPRLLAFPVDETPAGGLLESLQLETRRGCTDLLLDYHALKLLAPPELFAREGHPWEWIRGQYVPRRLHFIRAVIRTGENIPASLVDLPPQSARRLINDVWAWRVFGKNSYLFDLRRKADDTLLLEAAGCLREEHTGSFWNVELERDWSPAPLAGVRRIPLRSGLHHRYGGDPITIQLNGSRLTDRLFIGGLDSQPHHRPNVSAVLKEASRWVLHAPADPADRWVQKGEGSRGMGSANLAEEVGWVIEHLKRGERVLVHCSAGMNRSASVVCAVLIQLEGLSAEAALERLRASHPWARPDPSHWLALRWLVAQPSR